jgi:hypothetical protein
MTKSEILTPIEVPMLLIGFKRLDFLKARIDEISRTTISTLFLSLDGGHGLSAEEIDNFIQWTKSKLNRLDKLIIDQKTENLGLVSHVTSAISNVLSQYSHVVIVEDDIEISNKFYESIINGLNLQILNNVTGIVGGFSVLNLPPNKIINNQWRESNYIAIWGWGCSSDVWKNYKVKLDTDLINKELSNSHAWSKLSNFQKQVWLGRFKKIAENPSKTWDIQLQYLSFVNEFNNFYPVSTLVRNVGFSDLRSTNTKNKKPLWMSKNPPNSKELNSNFVKNFVKVIVDILDSNLVFGDTKLINYWKHRLKLRLTIRH